MKTLYVKKTSPIELYGHWDLQDLPVKEAPLFIECNKKGEIDFSTPIIYSYSELIELNNVKIVPKTQCQQFLKGGHTPKGIEEGVKFRELEMEFRIPTNIYSIQTNTLHYHSSCLSPEYLRENGHKLKPADIQKLFSQAMEKEKYEVCTILKTIANARNINLTTD